MLTLFGFRPLTLGTVMGDRVTESKYSFLIHCQISQEYQVLHPKVPCNPSEVFGMQYLIFFQDSVQRSINNMYKRIIPHTPCRPTNRNLLQTAQHPMTP